MSRTGSRVLSFILSATMAFLTCTGIVGAQVVPPPRLDPFGPSALRQPQRMGGPVVRWTRPPVRVTSPLAGMPDLRPLRYQRGDSIGQAGEAREAQPQPAPRSTGQVWSQREEYQRQQANSVDEFYRRQILEGRTIERGDRRPTAAETTPLTIESRPAPDGVRRVYDPLNCTHCGSGRVWTRDAANADGISLGRQEPAQRDPQRPGNVLVPQASHVREATTCVGCGRQSDVNVWPESQRPMRDRARLDDAARRIDLRDTIRAESAGDGGNSNGRACSGSGCSQIVIGRGTVRAGTPENPADYHGLRGVCLTCGTAADVVHGPNGYRGEATYPGNSRFGGNRAADVDVDAINSARGSADANFRETMQRRVRDMGPRH